MKTQAVRQELEQARANGPLRQIQIPPCPELLQRLRAAMSLPQPDLNEVGRVAAADVAMSATLLRVANSPLHLVAGNVPCTTVGQAMYRLGLDESVALMQAFLVRHAIPVNSPHLLRFWQRSTKRAIAMGFIAGQLPGMRVDLAQSYGLFCHVGMPVLLQSVRGYGATMVEAAARIDRPYIKTENVNHRTDHAVVGALVIKVWNLAPELMTAIRLHHDFEALHDDSIDPEVRTLIAAGLIAEQLMRQHEGLDADVDWAANRDAALAWLHLPEDELEQWDETLRDMLDEA
ncbi:HDOD domain-containing protein [Mitsuaria sp. GD03876]|uniref:HDOD domain-containing protein n=1 Tax=Mitsuaria sp. GD03876 TaxID=2975399 RepID=UPI00244C5ED8|nr:HDOD domain-containing protein [Mitsuaria sp. GD03876]MDH0864357.1 HDOD domain-containing protein [Mitsuaria sp. GD03876]